MSTTISCAVPPQASSSDLKILNIAAYKFVPLDNIVDLRSQILSRAKELELRGTVLLSREGINLFVAGQQENVRDFVVYLRADARFADLEIKESFSKKVPFNRMLVRLKKEIIAFGIDGIKPHVKTSPKLSASELKRWLDEGRDILLLDVRNDFEVAVGTFENAIASGIDHFRDFENSIERLPPESREKPIVMFCTGGIRCEKAGPLMQEKGYENVYQLEGGILKYFEEIGGAHYNGDCFVFDGRVAVDPKLNVSGLSLCFACQAVLTQEDQKSDKYQIGVCCPHCYRSPHQVMLDNISHRHQLIDALAKKLPGAEPHEQRRPIRIPARLDGWKLFDCIVELFPQIPVEDWELAFSDGRILEGNMPVRKARTVRGGEEFTHLVAGFVEPDVNAGIRILWEDECIVFVDKPAPLPIHPSGRFFHNSLTQILNRVYKPEILNPVHRLDANTTGVVLLSRRRAVTPALQQQFEQQLVQKTYFVRCMGHPAWNEYECHVPIMIRPGEGRIRTGGPTGESATTHFQVNARLDDGTSLLTATPLTGRTNQIRVHLWELGVPVLNDPLYFADHQLGRNEAVRIDAAAMCLHAKRLSVKHPIGGQLMEIEAENPCWWVE